MEVCVGRHFTNEENRKKVHNVKEKFLNNCGKGGSSSRKEEKVPKVEVRDP